MRDTSPARIIADLHSLNVGEMETIHGKLRHARQACVELKLTDLAEKLDEARGALERADLKLYRKRVETVVARLGHLK